MGQWVSNLGLSLLTAFAIVVMGMLGVYLMLVGFAFIGIFFVLGTAAFLAWASAKARPNNAWR